MFNSSFVIPVITAGSDPTFPARVLHELCISIAAEASSADVAFSILNNSATPGQGSVGPATTSQPSGGSSGIAAHDRKREAENDTALTVHRHETAIANPRLKWIGRSNCSLQLHALE